ncbi:response regulator transcription factor [candidate division KSB1 bacterium]|nr:response regulator transcription factor [candidate division KSB1 bacterium]
MEKGKILILGDENKVPDLLKHVIKEENFGSAYLDSVDNLNDQNQDEKPRAILIDLETHGDEGFELCRKLKDNFEVRKAAIILVAENANEDQIIKALEMGADDFLTMRYTKRELAARLKAIIRRIEVSNSKKIKVKDLEIDLDEHRVKKSGKPIDLTYIQFKLLYLLASRRDNVFSRKEILERVWGRKVFVTNRTVDVHIKRLREKLGEYKYPSQYIETIHGTGYRFL